MKLRRSVLLFLLIGAVALTLDRKKLGFIK